MSNLYRIEIDMVIENRMRTKIIQAARERLPSRARSPGLRKTAGWWKFQLKNSSPDTKTAFLELAESAFRSVLPDIEPDRFSCGIAEPELKMRAHVRRTPDA